MRRFLLFFLCAWTAKAGAQSAGTADLARRILGDTTLTRVQAMAGDLIASGFNAGSGYGEVWIRDFNTFITLSCSRLPPDSVKSRLKVFFHLQGADGNIPDGYIPASRAHNGYDYIYSAHAPGVAAHKNTVETDQETSLVQAVFQYVKATGDTAFLSESIDSVSVRRRLARAFDFLLTARYASRYGLLYGATTADWGDVQPETPWGVVVDSHSHPAIDIYDNAMMVIALRDMARMDPPGDRWRKLAAAFRDRIRRELYDTARRKFIPHLYLRGSPFPASFDENTICYHGGTAVAIEAGILTRAEVAAANARMLRDVRLSGAPSIGLTLYPPYPEGFFLNKGMYPYGYQNGGDWTWFGARMITQLVRYGYPEEAYREIRPMIDRVLAHGGFYEWYTRGGKPAGSASFRGSAGVLYTAVDALRSWAGKALAGTDSAAGADAAQKTGFTQ